MEQCMSSVQLSTRSGIHFIHGNDKGAALATSLVLLTVLTLLGTAAVVTGIFDTKIGGNYKTSVQALYAAEAGIEEARVRLRANTGVERIVAPSLPNLQWRAYVGSGAQPQEIARQKALQLGFKPGDPHHHIAYSFQPVSNYASNLDYTVEIKYATDSSGNVVPNHIVITSYGAQGGSNKTVEVVVEKPPSFAVPAALYVEAPTRIQGMTTEVIGTDSCGTDHKRGVVTTLPPDTGNDPVRQLASPTVVGTPDDGQYQGTDLDIPSIVSTFQRYANFAYTVSNATHEGNTRPGPGDNWGQPTIGATSHAPSSCNDYNVVHYDTGGTSIRLGDGVSGCGILLVRGNLVMSRGFSWYGLVVVTGTVSVEEPELQPRQIRGAVLAGGSGQGVPNLVAPDSHIVYCSTAINTQNLPLRVLRWREL
jgi:hypothetical protein